MLNFWGATWRDMMWYKILRPSFCLAHCASFMSRRPFLRREGLHILNCDRARMCLLRWDLQIYFSFPNWWWDLSCGCVFSGGIWSYGSTRWRRICFEKASADILGKILCFSYTERNVFPFLLKNGIWFGTTTFILFPFSVYFGSNQNYHPTEKRTSLECNNRIT